MFQFSAIYILESSQKNGMYLNPEFVTSIAYYYYYMFKECIVGFMKVYYSNVIIIIDKLNNINPRKRYTLTSVYVSNMSLEKVYVNIHVILTLHNLFAHLHHHYINLCMLCRQCKVTNLIKKLIFIVS